MTKANITQYSSTPSSNSDINDINIAENCPASNINNAIRELMAHLKNVDTGSQALTALSVTGATTSGTLKVSDGGTIGSASKTDAITIASSGLVQLTSTGIGAGSQVFQVIDDGATLFQIRAEDGNVSFPQAGAGIYLGVTSGNSANLLDDYEEGTWTPTYTTDGTGFGAITHDIQDGKYTKIGRTVTLTCRLSTSSVTHGSVSGSLSVSGAPFTPASGSGLNLYWVGFNSSFQSSQAPNVVRVSEGITNMELYELPSAGGYSFNDALAGTDLATGSNSNYVYFCLTYMSA